MKVYVLTNIAFLDDDIKLIGCYSTLEKAKEVADFYSTNVTGFNTYPNEFKIDEFVIDGYYGEDVWLLMSYKLDDDTEIDIKTVGVYVTKTEAENKKNELTLYHNDYHYDIEHYPLDESYWKEGFIRV